MHAVPQPPLHCACLEPDDVGMAELRVVFNFTGGVCAWHHACACSEG